MADDVKATVAGVGDKSLRQAIEHYMGTTKRGARSRFEARRRAEEAGDDAAVVLRSEGYYDYVITPDLSDGDPPKPIVRIDPGPRSVIAAPTPSPCRPSTRGFSSASTPNSPCRTGAARSTP